MHITLNAPFYFNQKAAFLTYLSFQSAVRTLTLCSPSLHVYILYVNQLEIVSNDVRSNWKTRMSKQADAKPILRKERN